jgi:hypothetical protein
VTAVFVPPVGAPPVLSPGEESSEHAASDAAAHRPIVAIQDQAPNHARDFIDDLGVNLASFAG